MKNHKNVKKTNKQINKQNKNPNDTTLTTKTEETTSNYVQNCLLLAVQFTFTKPWVNWQKVKTTRWKWEA